MAAKELIINSFISKVLGVVFGVLIVIVTSRWLGAEIRGEISFLLSWIGAWIIVSDFVSGSALINLSAKYSRKELWILSVKWVIFIALVSSVFFFLFPLSVGNKSFIIPVAILFMGIYNINGAILIGIGKINVRNYSFAAISFFTFLTFVLLAYFKNIESIGVIHYFICLLFAWLLMVFFTFFHLELFKTYDHASVSQNQLLKTVLKTGTLSQSGHLMQFLASRLPFFIMPMLFGMGSLGVFSNVVVLGEGVLIISASLGQILHAKIIHSDNPENDIPDLLKYTRLSLLLVIPATIVVALIPDKFWVWLLGAEFLELGKMFLIFSPMIIFQSISSVLSHFFHAANRFVLLVIANSIGVLFGFLGFIILSKFWGVNGFVIGVVCGYFAQFLYLVIIANKIYKINFLSFLPDSESFVEVFKLIKLRK